MSQPFTDSTDLQGLVAQLSARLTVLEEQVATLQASQKVPDDVMVAISAAVAAFLGHKATIKAVRFRPARNWTTEARGRVHNRAVR